jgi:hypothetical protein
LGEAAGIGLHEIEVEVPPGITAIPVEVEGFDEEVIAAYLQWQRGTSNK